MQSTMLKSIHHSISTLACLALAGTLAACGNSGGGTIVNGNANAPTITFDATTNQTQTYKGISPGGTFTNAATVDTNGFCPTRPISAYSSIDTSTDRTTDKITFSDVTPGEVTYKAAGSYIITASTAATAGCAQADATYDLTVNKATPTIKFNNPTTRVYIGETVRRNKAGLTGVGGDLTGDDGKTLDGISITYFSADTDKASVDASTGAVTGKLRSSTGAVTITARYRGSANYNPTSDEYQLTVTLTPADLTVDGSPIKKLIFSWRDVSDAAYYKLSKVDLTGGMNTQVGQDVTTSNTGGVQSITHIVPLFASAGTRYRLESCDSADTCVDSTNDQTITQAQLNRAIGYIKASNTGGSDQFGWSVSLSADGTTLAVGANREASDASGVYNNQSDWSSMDDNDATDSGAVYVFSRDASDDWTQDAYIKASNASEHYRFGNSLSLSADGTTLAVGAYWEGSDATGVYNNQSEWSSMHNNNGAPDSGAVYVFSRDASDDWTQQAYIKASNAGEYDRFGISLGLSADGTTLAVGAYREGSDATGVGGNQSNNDATGSGAVYVFTRDTSSDWSQLAYIKASNTGSEDYFGWILGLSADGTTLAVGAILEASNATGVGNSKARWDEMNNNDATSAGAVYVFTSTSSDWTQDAYIKASNTGGGDYFGLGLGLNANGTTLAVGARFEKSNATGIGGNQSDNSADKAGAVYVFTRTSSTSRDWTQQAYIKASNTGEYDQFGWSLSLDASGDTLAVGAYLEDSDATGIGGDQSDNSADNAGAVYLY